MDWDKPFVQLLNNDEMKVLNRVRTYFHSPKMSLADKLINARLIALNDIELGYFSDENERSLLQTYVTTLDQLLTKLHQTPLPNQTGFPKLRNADRPYSNPNN